MYTFFDNVLSKSMHDWDKGADVQRRRFERAIAHAESSVRGEN